MTELRAKGITKHIDLTDKEIAGVIDHAGLSVTTAKIADLAVTTGKLAGGAVTTAKLADLGVTEGKIASGAVTTAKLADLAVASGKIADGAITSAKIANLAVASGKIADLAVTSGKIADGAVTTGKLADASVTDAKLGVGAVSTAKIADSGVTKPKMGFKTWETVAEITITSPVQFIDFTGLDINTDRCYLLTYTYKNQSSTSAIVTYLFVEGDYTLGNYCSQFLNISGTTVSPSRSFEPRLIALSPLRASSNFVLIHRDPDGIFRFLSYHNKHPADAVVMDFVTGAKIAAVSNITTLRFHTSLASGIDVGSTFVLSKPKI